MRRNAVDLRAVKIALGPLFGLFVFLLVNDAALSPEARRLAGILVCTVWWWISEAMPLPVAGLLASCFCVVFSVGSAKQIMSSYADPIIFLFIGSFWIASAMSLHGLDRLLALRLLSLPFFSANPWRLVLGVGILTASISLWVSNTATVAMLLPIVLGILKHLPPSARSAKLETNLLLMLSFSASVGGLGTPVGTPPNLIGIGMLERLAGVHMTFANWCRMALPITVVSLFALILMFCPGLGHPQGWQTLGASFRKERLQFSNLTKGQINVGLAFLAAISLWLFASRRIPEGVSAVLAASLMFILPADAERMTMTWKEATSIDWGTIFLFGSGMSLGQMLFDTKLAEALGTAIVNLLHFGGVPSIAALSTALALVISELASNTASAGVAVPVALAVSKVAGVPPLTPALCATLGSSFGFLFPVSTPPNALVYGTGKVPFRRMMAYGFMLDVIGFLIVWLGAQIRW